MTDQTMTPEQALEWLEGLRNTTGDQVCAEIEAGKAAEAAQAFRAALEAARELPFVIEDRAGTMVLDWSKKGGQGCRPATEPEIQLWRALAHQPEAQGKAVAWMVGGEVFTSEAEAVEAIMQWGPSGAIATPLYTAAPKVAGVTGPARYFCDGPDGHFWCDDLELARRVVNAYDKDEDWTITDTLAAAHQREGG